MDQSNFVCGVTRIAFDLKVEALETTLMEHMELNVIILYLNNLFKNLNFKTKNKCKKRI